METSQDYMMRMIQILLDALISIATSINKSDEEGAMKKIDYSFSLFEKPKVFFVKLR